MRPARIAAAVPALLTAAVTVALAAAPEGTVAGRLVDPRGAPVSGARVLLFRIPQPGEIREVLAQEGRSYLILDRLLAGEVVLAAGDDGRFGFPRLAPGRYELAAVHPDRAPYRLPAVDVVAGGTTDLGTIVLAPAGRLAGRVVDSEGRPVDKARLEAGAAARDRWLKDKPFPSAGGTSDGEGRFELTGLPLGEPVEVTAGHDGFRQTKVAAVELPLDRPLRIELSRGGRIHGRVVGSDGRPIAGAMLHAGLSTATPLDPGYSGGKARSQADGRFEIPALAPGTFKLSVAAPGYPEHEIGGISVRDDGTSEPVVVRLERGEVRGRVLAPDGSPAPDALVVLWPGQRPEELNLNPQFALDRFAGPVLIQRSGARTDAGGEFHLGGLASGPATVLAEHDLGDAIAGLDVRPGVNPPIDLTLGNLGRIVGRVVDAGGKPVPRARVTLTSATRPGYEFAWLATDDEGRFVAHRLFRGDYRLEATAKDLYQAEPAVAATVAEGPPPGVELVLVPGEEVSGRLLGLSADALGNVLISAQRPGRAALGAKPDGEGRYRIAGLDRGRWKLVAYSPGNQPASGEVEVVEGGGPYRLDLEFGPD